jgi:hypothetical protein
LAQQTIGIADDNLLEVDGTPVDNDFAKFTANGLEGRSYAETRSDLDLEAGTDFYSKTAEDTWRSNVTQTEMGYVDGVTSDIQTQLGAKAPVADPTFTGEIGIGAVNVSETELGILEGATLTTTELNYVDGVTSDIQTQLNTVMTTSGTPVDDDFAKFTDGTTVEGRSYAEVKSDLSLDNVENTTHSTDGHTMTIDGRDVSTDGSKLDNIEASADVTDATNVAAAGAVMATTFAAKGDILSASADDTPVIVSVGADTNVLVANSGAAGGLSWSAATAPGAHKDTHDPEDGADALDTAAPAELASVQASGAGSSHSFARADHAHQIQHSIADNHLVTIDSADVADNDFAKFTADGLEGRTYAEVKTDLGTTTEAIMWAIVFGG